MIEHGAGSEGGDVADFFALDGELFGGIVCLDEPDPFTVVRQQ